MFPGVSFTVYLFQTLNPKYGILGPSEFNRSTVTPLVYVCKQTLGPNHIFDMSLSFILTRQTTSSRVTSMWWLRRL